MFTSVCIHEWLYVCTCEHTYQEHTHTHALSLSLFLSLSLSLSLSNTQSIYRDQSIDRELIPMGHS